MSCLLSCGYVTPVQEAQYVFLKPSALETCTTRSSRLCQCQTPNAAWMMGGTPSPSQCTHLALVVAAILALLGGDAALGATDLDALVGGQLIVGLAKLGGYRPKGGEHDVRVCCTCEALLYSCSHVAGRTTRARPARSCLDDIITVCRTTLWMGDGPLQRRCMGATQPRRGLMRTPR